MGLLVDFSPDGMMDNNQENNAELEAEFNAIVGGRPDSKEKLKGKSKWSSTVCTLYICSMRVHLNLRRT